MQKASAPEQVKPDDKESEETFYLDGNEYTRGNIIDLLIMTVLIGLPALFLLWVISHGF